MSDYAHKHHPQVIARKIACGVPPLNAYRAAGWREMLAEMGIIAPKRSSKLELYRLYREALKKGSEA